MKKNNNFVILIKGKPASQVMFFQFMFLTKNKQNWNRLMLLSNLCMQFVACNASKNTETNQKSQCKQVDFVLAEKYNTT